MISKDPQECYVYITLPRQLESVTAGRFSMGKNRVGAVGQFVYGKTYLERGNAVALDPVDLHLQAGTFSTARLSAMFSCLRDSAPDYWGRLVIEKHCGRANLSEIDYLLNSQDDRAGALAFGLNKIPPAPLRKFNKTLSLQKLQETADKLVREQIDSNDHETIQAQELILLGTSMGGARPKAVVEDDHGLWIAKFGRPDDRWNNPRVEHAMLALARNCGIAAAKSKIETVAGKDVLLVQRFDREKVSRGYHRARMISGLTLLQADDSVLQRERWSYLLMVEQLRRTVVEPKKDAADLFRRMCFNALISNSDDHPRNHALVAFDNDWKLSPAYDLTPAPSVSQERSLALACGRNGRAATARNLLSESSRFLLSAEEAESIVRDMQQHISSSWYSILRSHGVSERDTETIKSAFDYDGFNS